MYENGHVWMLRVATSLLRLMTDPVAKELHSILNNNNNEINPNHVNLNPCMFGEDSMKLAYKHLKTDIMGNMAIVSIFLI